MNTDQENNGLQFALKEWQGQPSSIPDMPLEEVRSKMNSFKEKVLRRNIVEIGAGAIVIVFMLHGALTTDSTWRFLMHLIIALGAVSMSATLLTKGWIQRSPPYSAPTAECVAFQRKQIQRQIDLLSKARYWYVLPLAVGVVGLLGEGIYQTVLSKNVVAVITASLITLLVIGFFVFVVWLNEKYGVKKLQAMLDLLPAD